jgi:hypothetical protein
VRDQGLAPCVEDEVPKAKFDLMGTPEDMAARIRLARSDTKGDQQDVKYQRDLIYKKGFQVNYSGKKDRLKARSLCPTRVSGVR